MLAPAAIALLFMVAGMLVLGLALSKPLSHDEHQFIASGALLADRLLLPYRDEPYFHTPLLTFVNAALFKLVGVHLLAARLWSSASALAMLALVFGTAMRLLGELPPVRRVSLAAAAVLLVLASPLFAFTSGYAWNHDFAVLLAVGAALALLRGVEGRPDARSVFAAGALLALAAGVRLSMAPLAAPFLAAALLSGAPGQRRRLRLGAACLAGLAAGALPTLILFALAPAQFLFGNFRYPELNTQFRLQTGYPEAMSAADKLAFLGSHVISQPAVLALLALFLATALLALVRGRPRRVDRLRVGFVLALLPFLLAGALAPTPSFIQYFYVFVPFIVLGFVFGLAALARERGIGLPLVGLLVVAIALGGLGSIEDDGRAVRLATGRTPEPIAVGRVGAAVASVVGHGPVLTLSPAYALEGGVAVYPSFVTGPFAWRTASLLTPRERAQFGLVAPDDLARALTEAPPVGVLVGLEGGQDAALVDYARARGYRAFGMPEGLTLWADCTRARCDVETR